MQIHGLCGSCSSDGCGRYLRQRAELPLRCALLPRPAPRMPSPAARMQRCCRSTAACALPGSAHATACLWTAKLPPVRPWNQVLRETQVHDAKCDAGNSLHSAVPYVGRSRRATHNNAVAFGCVSMLYCADVRFATTIRSGAAHGLVQPERRGPAPRGLPPRAGSLARRAVLPATPSACGRRRLQHTSAPWRRSRAGRFGAREGAALQCSIAQHFQRGHLSRPASPCMGFARRTS